MAKLEKRRPREYQTTLRVGEFIGRNTHGEHSALLPGEFRDIVDYEVYPKYLESRRGSQYNRPDSDYSKYADSGIEQGVVWDIGDEEYVITQVGAVVYYQALLDPGNPTRVNDFAGADTDLTTTDKADMFVQGDRVYVFHPSGNKVIEWNGSIMRMRDMGMSKPIIKAMINTTAWDDTGNISGKYTWAVEKVYQVSDADVLASSPNRRYVATHATQAREVNEYGTVTDTKMRIYINADELDDDTLWTHIRLWRSKNQNMEFATPAEPIDAAGVPNELYEVALITKTEIERSGVAAIATSTDGSLPVGNKNVQAGVEIARGDGSPTNDYCIEDNCTDNELYEFIGIEGIELIPFPACNYGIFHDDRIFISGIEDDDFSDGTKIAEENKEQIYYSPQVADKYRECFSTVNKVLGIQSDGQQMRKLISFEKDLIAIKESKTMRLPDGNVELEIETTDHRTGIAFKTLAQFIPEVGIVAITNDYGDFKIYGFNHIWTGIFNGINIAIQNRVDTSAMQDSPDYVSFIYVNGKLMISDGTGVFHVLNVEAGRGWSRFSYQMGDSADLAFTFANGRRAGIVTRGQYMVEIEVEDLDFDVDVENDVENQNFTPSYTTWKFQSQDGADVLEHEWLSIMASPSGAMTVTPFANDEAWPSITVEKQTNMTVDANVESHAGLKDREYRLFLEPETMGTFDYCPMIGNFLHYKVETKAPAIIKAHKLFCIVDEDGIAFSQYDPFQTYGDQQTTPPWDADIIQETGVAATVIEESGSQPDQIIES